jgi:hypothetical protein
MVRADVIDSSYRTPEPEDHAATGVGWMISNLGPSVDALPRISLFVPPFSNAVHVWRKADKGMRTDEAQIGHWGLHRDPSIVNISSQSIHRNISLSFMMSSAVSFHVASSTLLRPFPLK